jgi:hypothetical protein
MVVIVVSETLKLEIVSGGRDPHVTLDRSAGGLVRIEPSEVCHLAAALAEAAGLLASAEVARSSRSSDRAVVEARRLRRRRVGPGPAGDGDRGRGNEE